MPGIARHYRQYLPLVPARGGALRPARLRPRPLQLALRRQGRAARPGALHLCYCHTPMRYVWDRYDDYFGPGRLGPLARAVVPAVCAGLRAWDVATARPRRPLRGQQRLRRRSHPTLLRPRRGGDPAARRHGLLHPGRARGARPVRPRGLGARALQADRARARGLPRHGPSALDRGRRPRGGAAARGGAGRGALPRRVRRTPTCASCTAAAGPS